MPQEYTKEQLWKLYDRLPAELKEAIFSAETADAIYNTCLSNGIEEARIPEVAALTGNVLLGIVPQSDFQSALEKDLKIKKDAAKKISQGINRFVFFPVKEHLASFRQSATVAPPIDSALPVQERTEEKPAPTKAGKEPAARQQEKDTYREKLE